MDQDKRKTIVAEIEQWRRSRLLPEHYCDFLLNLYQDEKKEKTKSVLGLSQTAVKNSNGKQWLAIFGIIGLICFLGLHFTSFPIGMQTGVAGGLTAILYLVGAVQREKHLVVSYLCFGTGSVLLLMGGLYLLTQHGISGLIIVAYVALCSLVWIATGLMARLPMFHFAGWVVLFLIYAYVLRHNRIDFDWIALELSWVPVSLVLVWLAWLFHYRNKQIAAVLMAAGLLAWFGSEAYGLALTELDSKYLQLLLLTKLIVACTVLFGSRKKWIEWVM